MITLTHEEMVTLMRELSGPGFKVYMYFMSTYTHEWQEYDVKVINEETDISRSAIYRALNDLIKKGYIKKNETPQRLIRIRVERSSPKSGTGNPKSGTGIQHIKNIKRERDYLFILINIIFLILNRNISLSLSDIPYRENPIPKVGLANPKSGTGIEQINLFSSFSEEFYQQIEEMEINLNAELKRRLEYLGIDFVSDLYYRTIWDRRVRKPGTIFLREVLKAYRKKRDDEKEVEEKRVEETGKYFSVAGSRELSMRQIYDEYKSTKNFSKEKIIESWRRKSIYYGYTESEMNLFKREVIDKEVEEGEERMDE